MKNRFNKWFLFDNTDIYTNWRNQYIQISPKVIDSIIKKYEDSPQFVFCLVVYALFFFFIGLIF
jgi:hypothetical protein